MSGLSQRADQENSGRDIPKEEQGKEGEVGCLTDKTPSLTNVETKKSGALI
jgi:hypothetical protein